MSDPAHRRPLRLLLGAHLGDHSHRTLPQLRRVPPRRTTRHDPDPNPSKDWSLRTRRGGSVPEHELSFERIVELADLGATGEVEYSVKYSRGPHGSPSGLLLPGQSVKVKKGMRFVAKATVRS
ncbi:MAG: multiubiquitin domain-containing protein [Actinobacteria bacterium]|nr:multiubiquitin domain-containing protein [Actinomycetota bacterium]